MTKIEILEELRKLSTKERLEVLESTIHLLQEDLQQKERLPIEGKTKKTIS